MGDGDGQNDSLIHAGATDDAIADIDSVCNGLNTMTLDNSIRKWFCICSEFV